MGFFDDLGGALSTSVKEQFGLADNKPGDLDSAIGPITIPYGKLGDFASQIDKSAHRRYIESGIIRNLRPRAMEVISQQPEITVLVKKRLFSSLQENYKLNLLDEDEALFLRASKALFERKCQAIAAYERLTKFQNIANQNGGVISDFAFPAIIGSFEALESFGVNFDGKTRSTVNTVKKVKAFSTPSNFTTWLNDQTIPFASPQGPGTGVIEFTNVSGVETKTSVDFGSGSASVTMEDPYKIMLITNNDIDDAINEATNLFSQNSFFKVTENQLQTSINTMKQELNRIRRNSQASEIRFVISEETILSKKVRAFIDEEAREIKFNFDAGNFGLDILSFNPDTVSLYASATKGKNGLQGPEIDLFKRIVNDIFVLAALRQSTRSEIRQYNESTNAIRKKMHLHYAGKPIIQPMDVIYVYIGSKTLTDSLISKGFERAFVGQLTNQLDDTIEKIENVADNIANTFSGGTLASSHIENEKNAIAGPDFPMWLWNLMRNDFTQQSAGTCAFVGIVGSSSHNYSNGKYTLNVSAKDNTHYFNKSYVNINPSLDVFNSALYDPLTPFKLNFDVASGMLRGEVPELLDANIRLLNSGSIRAKTGRNRGGPVTETQFLKNLDVEHVASGLGNYSGNLGRDFRVKFSDPDGFVYKWKEGIGSLVLFGEPYGRLAGLGSFASEASPKIRRDPFVGQDTMNVLSLLITGEPYNFNNFVRGAFSSGNLNRQDLFNEPIYNTFLKGLISDLTQNNSVWGNFVPFKNLVVNEQEYSFLTSGEFDLINRNRTLSQLVRRRAEVFDELAGASAGVTDTAQFYKIGEGGDVGAVANVNVGGIEALSSELNDLDRKISSLRDDFEQHVQNKDIQSPNGTLQIIGDDVSFDPTITGGTANEDTEAQRRDRRAQLRRDTNYLSLRRLWAVKGNEDKNLFIVDDTYDKNYDIQQFEEALSGQMEKFKSSYTNVFDQINLVRKILGLEVYADSQGHIRARPPQYNKMPSSVFREMIQNRAQNGIKIFPEYLEGLFFNTIQGITDQLEIIEDQIRLKAAALGRVTDGDVEKLLGGGIGAKGATFKFLTKESDGKFGGLDIRNMLRQNTPDLDEAAASKALESLNTLINTPLNATINFDIVKRIEVASEQISFSTNASSIQNRLDLISSRLKERTRDPRIPSNVQDIFSFSRVISLGTRRQSDVLKVTNEISQSVAERQRLIKTLAPSVANLREGLAVNKDGSSSTQALLTPNLYQKPDNIYPELLESMIEDEDNHDLGPGSGNRFVLTDAKIISFTLMENEPEYNSIQVDGRLGQGLVSYPQGLEASDGGNAMGTAWAIDYDLWQMYGLRQGENVTVPFFQDPNGQCAPYAAFLLNLQRKQILKANATIVGNEFVQPGEVYYIEDYDLLFYASSVSHSLTYNGQFITSLELTFGRHPGAYIPTQLDVIGKGLYSHRHQANLLRHVRHNRADDSRAIGLVIRDSNSTIFDGQFNNVKALIEGTFGEQNRKNLGNVMLATTGLLTPTTHGRTLKIELRTYYNSDKNISENTKLTQLAESVKSWLIDPRQVSLDGETLLPDSNNRPLIDSKRVNSVAIDLSHKIQDDRSPSSQGWAMARNITASGNLSYYESITAISDQHAQEGNETEAEIANESAIAALAEREVRSLSNNIIDIWITFEDPNQIVEES